MLRRYHWQTDTDTNTGVKNYRDTKTGLRILQIMILILPIFTNITNIYGYYQYLPILQIFTDNWYIMSKCLQIFTNIYTEYWYLQAATNTVFIYRQLVYLKTSCNITPIISPRSEKNSSGGGGPVQ